VECCKDLLENLKCVVADTLSNLESGRLEIRLTDIQEELLSNGIQIVDNFVSNANANFSAFYSTETLPQKFHKKFSK